MHRRRTFLIGGAILGLGSAGFLAADGRNRLYASITESTDGGTLTVEEAHARATAGEITLVDIRRPEEWASTGSGEGALRLDMRRVDFIEALRAAAGEDGGAPIALICARGVRSARLTNALTEAGFTNIIDVPEGMLGSLAGPGWLQKGLPVVHQD